MAQSLVKNTKEPLLRLFFGVRMSEAVDDEALHLIRQLALLTDSSGLKVVWIPRENLHVTLRFLGSTPESQLDAIKAVGLAIASHHSPVEVYVEELGAFPTLERARSLWVDLKEKRLGSSSRLSAIAAGLETELQTLGFSPEKRAFAAHLTLGRVKAGHGVSEILARFPHYRLGSCTISELVLFKSELRPAGSVYVPLEVFPLKG